MKEQLIIITGVFSFCMRIVATICVSAILLMAQAGGVTPKDNDQKAKDAIDTALKALGGADKIDGIKSLIIKGSGNGPGTSYKYEIRMLLPGDIIRISRLPDRITYNGLSQGKLLTPVVTTLTGPTADNLRTLRYWREVIEWSIFLSGTLMKSASEPLVLSSTNMPGLFGLSIPAGVFSDIEFDSETGFPSVIRYSELPDFGGNTNVYKFSSDRFSVDGIMFPRVITSALMHGSVEMHIEEVQINPKLSLSDFEIPE